jgi:hypothetical protein
MSWSPQWVPVEERGRSHKYTAERMALPHGGHVSLTVTGSTLSPGSSGCGGQMITTWARLEIDGHPYRGWFAIRGSAYDELLTGVLSVELMLSYWQAAYSDLASRSRGAEQRALAVWNSPEEPSSCG